MPEKPSLRVAIVEDDPVFRAAILQALAGAADIVVGPVAASRSEGLALLREPPCEVLLVDLGLPDGSGVDVIRAAHDAWPACNVVVSTAFGDEQHVISAIQAGASGYLLKDTPGSRLVEEIRSASRGESPISPLIARRVLQLLRDPAAYTGVKPAPGHGVAAEALSLLSPRESEVLRLVAIGHTYEEIAQRMKISRHTVLTFVRRIYAKLEVNSKMEAVNEARRQGLLGP